MSEANFNILQLWPKFELLIEPDFTSPEGLSAAIVAVIFFVAAVSGLMALRKYFGARNRVRFYRKLIEKVEPGQLLEMRRDISNASKKSKKYGNLWTEFDESLVHIPQRSRLCNTLDAGHFFNTHTLAGGLTENRLLAAVPAFITAIGVIGTFAGLQMGLSELSSNMKAEAQIDDLKIGIFGMIGGASIAFMTSVWGVFVSVLFNFYEKTLERSIRSKIGQLQNRLDYLYPRITAEQSLTNIEELNRQSAEKLAELDEKIGNKMQEAMRQASDSIRDGMERSLTEILGPAISQLVDNANSGSEKALESLLERFLQGVGSAGQSQRDMMEGAAEGVRDAAANMTDGLQRFVGQLETQMDSAFSQNAAAVANVRESLTTQMDEQQRREIERHDGLRQLLAGVQGTQGQLTETIQASVDSQQSSNVQLSQELAELISQLSEVSASHSRVTESLHAASSDMKVSSISLGQLSDNVKSTIGELGDRVGDAVAAVDRVSENNATVLATVDKLTEQLQHTATKIEVASAAMDSAAGKAEGGLSAVDQHFNSLAQTLEAHVEELQKQVAALLNAYAERVQDQTVTRLNTWNEQTNAYIGSMTNAVQVLNDVVDDIDGKVAARRVGSVA